MKDKIRKLEQSFFKTGVGPAPDRLNEEGKKAWDELVALAPPGK
jgi:hypothetical protein